MMNHPKLAWLNKKNEP